MTLILGIDPGPKPGIVALRIENRRVTGCTPLLENAMWQLLRTGQPDLVSCEAFRISERTAHLTRAGTEHTLGMITDIRREVGIRKLLLVQYGPGLVKPWATDDRLRAWGVYLPGDHVRDAVRHALYAAVYTGFLPKRPVQ